MSGPRYAGWTHKQGADSETMARMPEARKLLGAVIEDAERNKLGVHKMSRVQPDGGVITAEVHGGIPRISVSSPPPGKSRIPPRVKEHFVVKIRNSAYPDGIDEEFPETMERVENDEWRTLFHSARTPGYGAFPGKKGTYRTQNGIEIFPDGVNHAGNIDWRGASGLRVSWYGPSTRYFYDPYVLPRSQYGKYVFMLGQRLLDVDAYIEFSDDEAPFDARWVMGAALSGPTELLVVHANLPESIDYPVGDAPPGDMHVSQPWPDGAVTLELCRYELAPKTDDGAPFLDVVPNSRVVLATTTVAGAWNPWFFSPDATQAVSHALPNSVLVRPSVDFSSLDEAPSASSLIATLVVEDGVATFGTTAVSLAPDGDAALASDYKEDGTRVDLLAIRRRNDGGFDTRGLKLGGHEVLVRHVYDFRDIAGRPGSTFDRRALVWADLREGVLVISRRRSWQRLNAESPTLFWQIEVWQNGVLVGGVQQNMRSNNEDEFTGLPRLDGSFSDDLDDSDMNHVRAVSYAPALVMYEMLDYSPQVANRRYWHGAHGLYLNLAYPASEYFGSFVAGRNHTGNPYVEIRTLAADQAHLNYEQRDVNGRAHVAGVASYGGVTVYSGWQVNVGGYEADPHYATFTAPFYEGFPTIGGGAARCLPVWLLGTLPRDTGAL